MNNKHNCNGLPEKPTGQEAGRPYMTIL